MSMDQGSSRMDVRAAPAFARSGRRLLAAAVILLSVLSACSDSGPATGSISGSVTVPAAQSGTIYVLAIPAENAAQLRVAETEARPHRSAWVARYTELSAPGTYTLDGLAPGSYVVWGWVDVNGDGGVNHSNYAEPVGWYQTRATLYLAPVPVEAGANAAAVDLRLVAPTPYPEQERTVTAGQGGGTLKTVRGQKVLQLWGTPEERAYAHGFLAGPQIVDFFNYVVVEYFARSVDVYRETLQYVQGHFAGHAPYAGEAGAMLRGMRDSGTNMTAALLGRELTRDDLIVQNNAAILRFWKMHASPFWPLAAAAQGEQGHEAPLCTSAVFWGNWTQNPELGGAVIHGNNNDGENDLRKITVNSTLIIATTPPPGSGKKRTVGIEWPGYYGNYHGMNEDGLAMVAHSSMSVPDWDAPDLLDYSFYYREALQTASSIDGVVNLWATLPATPVAGFNTPISTPYRPGQAGYPSATYETDSYGGALRTPVDFTPADQYAILTTNNYYRYQGTQPHAAAVSKVHGYHATVEARDYRFQDMLNLTAQFRARNRAVGTPEMIELLRAASTSQEFWGVSAMSIIWYPNTREFALAKEDLIRKILDAPFTIYNRFTFAEVFQ